MCIFALALFSYVLDPLSLYHSSTYIPPLPPNSARVSLSSYSNITKAKRIVIEKPSRILLGSSIVDHGFRLPGSLALWYNPYSVLTKRILDVSGPRAAGFYNAAIRGGGMREMWDYLQLAYRENPKLESVILGTEFGMSYPMACMPHIPRVSLLDEEGIPLSFTLEYLMSPLVLRGAYEVFYASPHNENLARYLLSPKELRFPLPLRDRDHCPKAEEAEVPTPPFSLSAVGVVSPERKLEFERFVFGVWYVNLLHKAALAGEQASTHAQALVYFSKIIEFCRVHSIDLQVYKSPQPAVFWALLQRFGMQKSADLWTRELTRETAVWDFESSIDYNSKADALFTTDPLHFTQEGGEIILSAILNRRYEVARHLSAEQSLASNNQRAVLLQEWEKGHQDVWDAILSLPVESMANDPRMFTLNVASLQPVFLDPEDRGYRIVRVLGRYIAVPAINLPPLDGYQLLAGKYAGTLKAQSIEEIEHLIDTLPSRVKK